MEKIVGSDYPEDEANVLLWPWVLAGVVAGVILTLGLAIAFARLNGF